MKMVFRPPSAALGVRRRAHGYGDDAENDDPSSMVVDAAKLIATVNALAATVRKQQAQIDAYYKSGCVLQANMQKVSDYVNKLSQIVQSADDRAGQAVKAATVAVQQLRALTGASGETVNFVPNTSDRSMPQPRDRNVTSAGSAAPSGAATEDSGADTTEYAEFYAGEED